MSGDARDRTRPGAVLQAAPVAPTADPRDPRFRPFRIAAYAVYLVLVCTFSGLVIFSVVRSVISMSPGTPPEAEPVYSDRECLDGLDRQWRSLQAERDHFTAQPDAKQVDDAWSAFRVGWLTELRALESHCAVRSRNREELARVFRRLEKVQNLFTTQSVQYSGEVGPAIDSLRDAFVEARKVSGAR